MKEKDWVDKKLEDPEFRKDFEEELRKFSLRSPMWGQKTSSEVLEQLAADDSNPCAWCRTANNKHSHLYGNEIKRKRELGNAVLICEGPDFPVGDENLLEVTWLMFRCVVTPAPENPCDSDFMEKISS